MKRIACLTALLLSALLTGCTINHPIDKDYAEYLANNQGESALPQAQAPASYGLTEQTRNHHYEFRAATVGYAHLWIVDFGKLLDTTLQSRDVQKAFGSLQQGSAAGDAPYLVLNLEQYRFEDYRAYVTLNIEVQSAGKTLFSKRYSVEGKSQGGKMWLGGPFAMKNATQQSTKLAIDEILRRFIQDYNQLQLSQR